MATEIAMTRMPNNALVAATQADWELVNELPRGGIFRVKITKMRNGAFHRKFFAMLHAVFDAWEPDLPEWHGIKASKDFDTFRNDIMVMAGFREVVVKANGDVKVVAKSVSFSAMDDTEFARVYNAVFDTCSRLLHAQSDRWTPEELRRVCATMESFA